MLCAGCAAEMRMPSREKMIDDGVPLRHVLVPLDRLLEEIVAEKARARVQGQVAPDLIAAIGDALLQEQQRRGECAAGQDDGPRTDAQTLALRRRSASTPTALPPSIVTRADGGPGEEDGAASSKAGGR